MTIPYTLVLLLLLVIVLFLITGLSMKKEHRISRNIFIKAPLDQVWNAVTDVVRQIEWRTDLQKIELKESTDGCMVWAEISKTGSVSTQRVLNSQENKLFETETLPTSIYSGHSITEFSPSQAGTTLRITESLRVENPLKRPFARTIKKLELSANQYQEDLKHYLEVSPSHSNRGDIK